MKVTLQKSYPVPGRAETAWAILRDLEAVAGCMPGARITERIDDRHYRGTVAVRVGPASMSFRGTVEIRDVDAAGRSLRLIGTGTDSTGSSAASMDLAARIESSGPSTSNLVGTSEVTMSGKAASFGGRMMDAVADQVLKQFADNFAARVAALEAPQGTGSAPGGGSAPMPGASNGPAPRATSELNALALLWAIARGWLRALFGKKAA